MIESTRPKLNRFKYAAMLAGALAVAASPLAYPAVASAERVWDIEYFDSCRDHGLRNTRMDYHIPGFSRRRAGLLQLSDGVLERCSSRMCQAPPG